MEFKDIPWKDKISEDEQIAVYLDKYPVTKGHILVVPKYNNLTAMAEAFKYAVSIGRHQVAIGEWDGFNVGMNNGKLLAKLSCGHIYMSYHADTVT